MLPLPEAAEKLDRLKKLVDEYNLLCTPVREAL